ncbi:MAG: hypothetical protein M5U12_12665 [Verrucomicrobia bacterium]|nr:hypothetical protein [Verrucomicrobiota bacterium]
MLAWLVAQPKMSAISLLLQPWDFSFAAAAIPILRGGWRRLPAVEIRPRSGVFDVLRAFIVGWLRENHIPVHR